MLNILVVNTVPYLINGISSVIMNYYDNTKNNINYDFIVNDYIDDIYMEKIAKNNDKIYLLRRSPKKLIFWLRDIKKIIEKNGYDIIHLHGNSSTIYLESMYLKYYFRDIKIIVHGHSRTTDNVLMHKILKNIPFKKYDYAFTASEEAGNWLFDNKNFTVINNGIKVDSFIYNVQKRKSIRKKLNIPNNAILFLHVGHFNNIKNQELVLQIFERLNLKYSNLFLLFIGDGQHKKKIREQYEDGNIIFLSPTSEIASYYSAADIFLFPSKSESFGMVVLEAECSGLYCIISDEIPSDVIINEDIVDVVSLKDSLEKWVKVCEDTIKKIETTDRCNLDYSKFKKFDIEHNVNKMINDYKKIKKGRSL